MDRTYWHKQAAEPLFPDLLWSRPENRQARGKLLIVGGNLHGFSAPAEAYREADKAGVGNTRVLLPNAIQPALQALARATHADAVQGSKEKQASRTDSTASAQQTPADAATRRKHQRVMGSAHEQAGAMSGFVAEFGASTPSGSFASQAYAELAMQAAWADGVVLAGDLGRNSETAVLLEKFTEKFKGQLTITKDALDYFKDTAQLITDRPATTLVASLAQLQKLFQNSSQVTPITFGMGLVQLVDVLHDFTNARPCNIVVKHLGNIVVAFDGKVSTTSVGGDPEIWRVKTAACAAVWWLQNPEKTFEALTTSVFESLQN